MNIEPLLEPELKAAFTAMPYRGDLTEDLAATRRMVVEMVAAARAQSPRNDQVTIEDGSIPGPKGAPNVPVRVYTPSTRTGALPGLLWMHGGDLQSEVSPYAAPARATDLSGLPPTYIGVAELDVLRDEAVTYAARLMQTGVTTELHVFPGTIHGFEVMVPTAAVSHRAVSEYIEALGRALSD